MKRFVPGILFGSGVMWEGGRDGEGTRVDCSYVFLSSVLDTKDYLFSTCGGFQVIIACVGVVCVCVLRVVIASFHLF